MQKKKKIICTVTNDLNYDRRMIRICSSLVTFGYEVLLLGRRRSFSPPLIKEAFQQKRFRCWFNKGLLFYAEFNIRLSLYLLFTRFDLVCAIDLDTILPGFWVARFRKKICVYDAHEYFTEVPEITGRPGMKKFWEWIAQSTIPHIQHSYTVNESLAHLLEKRYQTPFQVIRNVPFAQPLSTVKKPDKPIILYLGALNDGRGLEQLIDCLPQLPELEFWLAGEGDLSNSLRQKVTRSGLDQRVRFLGLVQPNDLKHLIPQATIGLNLLVNNGLSYYYSLANKTFDYIQAGIPSIQMNYPEYKKINEQFQVFHLVDNLEQETLVRAIQKLLNDPRYYQKLHKNCLQAQQEFIWEKEKQKLKRIYAMFWG